MVIFLESPTSSPFFFQLLSVFVPADNAVWTRQFAAENNFLRDMTVKVDVLLGILEAMMKGELHTIFIPADGHSGVFNLTFQLQRFSFFK
ncbi:hypothetical protein EYF80_027917 [Liparis tanakae]|uniref:Uncharacterized protein n=1 Tax=Liparis tanakae TaxID=230148 RepID=A0A4Z2H8H0_9TELE|nr:hypothetical protein EYF80_027917 [Liparis tanakae]